MSSVAPLYRAFLKAHVPSIKRIGRGHIALMELLYTTYRSRPKIGPDDEVFIQAGQMQDCTKQYAIIRAACCVMKGYHNKEAGTCDLIIGWSVPFSDAMFCILQSEFRARFSARSRDREEGLSLYVSLNAFPGASPINYTASDKTHRLHHRDQCIPKVMKRLLFKGCTDYDIQACFPSIFRTHVLAGTKWEVIDSMIDRPDAFLQAVIDSDAFTHLLRIDTQQSPRQKAKTMRSRLFHPPAKGALPRTGCAWYDDLGDIIAEHLRRSGIEKPHLYFTMIEQEIIECAFDAFGRDDILLRMHDGFIAWGTDDVPDRLQRLGAATGYKWSASIYDTV